MSRVDEPAEETLFWDGVDRWGIVEIVRGGLRLDGQPRVAKAGAKAKAKEEQW